MTSAIKNGCIFLIHYIFLNMAPASYGFVMKPYQTTIKRLTWLLPAFSHKFDIDIIKQLVKPFMQSFFKIASSALLEKLSNKKGQRPFRRSRGPVKLALSSSYFQIC
jgi:hypothetical protein